MGTSEVILFTQLKNRIAMKNFKLILISVFFFFFMNFTYSQDEKHEISLGYGLVSHDQVLEVFEDVLVQIFTVGYAVDKDYTGHAGPVFVSYEFYPLKWMSTGVGFGLDYSHGDLIDKDNGDEEGVVVGNFKRSAYSIVYEHAFRYINKPVFQMYSGFAIGYTIKNINYEMNTGEKESSDANHMAFQFNAVGFRFGKQIGGFFEFGYGYKGIFNGGISARF